MFDFSEPCNPNPCAVDEVCRDDGHGGHTCDDPCFHSGLNPCQNGGNCTNDGLGGYVCECGGYDGKNCQIGRKYLIRIWYKTVK